MTELVSSSPMSPTTRNARRVSSAAIGGYSGVGGGPQAYFDLLELGQQLKTNQSVRVSRFSSVVELDREGPHA